MIKTGHKTTDEWMAKQAIWNGTDMTYAVLFGIVLGFIVGLII